MAVVNMTVGATTPDGATFAVKAETGPVRVLVADNPSMSGGVFFGPESLDANGSAKVAASGLSPATRYWWRVEDDSVVDTSLTGQFRTLPQVGSLGSFTIGVSSCAGSSPVTPGVGDVLAANRVSNHEIFGTIQQRAIDEGWLGFAHLGDLHYYDLGSGNHGITGGGSVENYRRAIDDVLLQPGQHLLYRTVPWWHVWDDHDYGPNDSDGTLATKANAAQVYRERIPHYTLDDSDGIWQNWQVGRILFVLSDVRYYRSPNTDPDDASKTMLGADQKTWLANLLASSDAEVLVWLMPDQWLRTDPDTDTWGAFASEREEILTMLESAGWLDRMVMVCGDRHALGLDRGGNNFGGFPVLLASSLDSMSGTPMAGVYDSGPDSPGRNRYGTVDVEDTGPTVRVTLSGWIGETLWRQHSVTFLTGTTTVASASVTDFASVVSGSHDMVTEARLVTGFQTTDNPDGFDLPVLGGDVQFDATAEVFATLQLDTVGIDETTGKSWFPRRPSDPLGPYGNEIFVRRGVDIGSRVLWSPLGYFRIESPEQDGESDSPIRIMGADRMAGIIEATMLAPREFPATTSVIEVFISLVSDVYPSASIVFDDDSQHEQIGRVLVVDESRYAALLELADSLGKVMWWDGDGVLRVESAPPDDQVLWEVRAGRGGVLVKGGRRVTRRGAFNALILTTDGGDSRDPVRGVAVDIGPNSPTRWGGPFGRVPRRERVSLALSKTGADAAAREKLRRNLGALHSADFSAVVNPALRPRMPVRLTHKDGSRDVHIVETCTIPLTAAGRLTATTRERTQVVIGSVVR